MFVPGGKLYHLRVNPSLGTYDGSTPNVQFTVYDGNKATPLTCNPYTPPVFTCNDDGHQYAVRSGDQLQIVANLPDSNTTLSGVSATVEEALSQ
jgi:hypothetical protein